MKVLGLGQEHWDRELIHRLHAHPGLSTMSWAAVERKSSFLSMRLLEQERPRNECSCNSPSPFTSSDRSPIKLNETEPAWYYKHNHSSLCARSDVSITVRSLNKLTLSALKNSEGYRVGLLINFETDSKNRWCWKLGRNLHSQTANSNTHQQTHTWDSWRFSNWRQKTLRP